MTGATRQVEITIRTTNEPTTLGRLMALAVSCRADVLAACSRWDGTGSVVKLVTQNAQRTTRALRTEGFNCTTDPVVLVELPPKPGLFATLRNKLMSAGIRVLDSYSFRSEPDRSYAVFRTTDDGRALYLLELNALIHDLAAAKSWHPSEAPAEEADTERQAA